ncbi:MULTISPECIES: SET domain-containing protein-lysine N-methyltransferase [unclassified Pseudomonas]|uniref:SET domain-containing protein-lysine N-methyltransferase n=1 Tax=unclassified Pseudomonas TaxID=196821 RepID=UPI003267E1E9
MKTQAMDTATSADSENDSLYPFATTLVESGYPSMRQFEVVRDQNGETVGIKSRVDFDNRSLIARVFGYALNDCRPHTFQISTRIRLYDPWFCGQLRHSCEPNLYFDTAYLQLWSVMPIAANTWLTIDFAKTGSVLPRQFACQCGCEICRGWIKGPEEELSQEGYLFFQQQGCLSGP